MGLVKDTLGGLAELFKHMDWKDYLGILLLMSLLIGVLDGYTDRELLPGVAGIFGIVGELVTDMVVKLGVGEALGGLGG